MLTRSLVVARVLGASLLAVLGGCIGSEAAGGDADVSPADTGPDCGGCPQDKICCPSRFEGDIPRCVDPAKNPENCGTCGTACAGACEARRCVDAPACEVGVACPGDLTCPAGAGAPARCCPPGTTFLASPADFFGCCPDGDICGCREGQCPISVRQAKTDIRYVDGRELAELGRELLATRLATYYYKDRPGERRQLGFIIDDGVPWHGIAADRQHVDLYGYVSLAVATLQVQAEEIRALRRDLDALTRRLDAAQPGGASR